MDAAGQIIEIKPAHSPKFICIDNSQECGLYEIERDAYERSESLEVIFEGTQYHFKFGASRVG